MKTRFIRCCECGKVHSISCPEILIFAYSTVNIFEHSRFFERCFIIRCYQFLKKTLSCCMHHGFWSIIRFICSCFLYSISFPEIQIFAYSIVNIFEHCRFFERFPYHSLLPVFKENVFMLHAS